MNTRKLIFLFTALLGLAVSAFAQSTATEATVARVTGTVTATLADGSTVNVKNGTMLPQGATITTGANSEAYLVSHGDTTSVITADSVVEIAELSTTTAGGQVTEQVATLDLKSGNIVAKLNPAKKSVNNYSVRTPKGVAAARGTVFTVKYNGKTYRLAVVNGTVSFRSPTDSSQVSVGPRGLLMNGIQGDWTNPDEVSSSEAALTQNEMAIVVATMAVAAANNIGGTKTSEFTEVLNVVLAAAPNAAPAIAALVAKSAPSLSSAVTSAVNTIAPSQNSAVQQAVQDATTKPTGSTPQTTPQPIDPNTISRSN